MGLLESLVSIKNIKDSIKKSLSNKGITMTNKTFSDYPSIIDSLDLEKHTLVEKSQTLTTNGTHTLNCDTNKPFSKVTTIVNVNNKTQTKTKSITSNGTVDITPDSGYDGLSSVSVTTNVPDYPNTRNSLYNKYMVSTKTNDTTMNTEIGKLPTFFTPSTKVYNSKTCYDMYNSDVIQIPSWHTRGTTITDLYLNIPSDYPVNGYQAFAGGYSSGWFPYSLTSFGCTGSRLKLYNGYKMFMNCRKLTHLPLIDLSYFDGTDTTSLHYMFQNCYGLERIDLVGSPSINMNYMFYNCTGLKEVHGLDISNCTGLGTTFYGCTNLQVVDFSSSTKFVSGCIINLSYCTNMTTENLVKTIMTLPDNNTGGTVTVKLTSTQMTNLMNYKSGTTSTGVAIFDTYPSWVYIAQIKKITLSTS